MDGILRVHSDQAEVPELEILRVAKERGKTLQRSLTKCDRICESELRGALPLSPCAPTWNMDGCRSMILGKRLETAKQISLLVILGFHLPSGNQMWQWEIPH